MKSDGTHVVAYKSDNGSVLEIITPWKHVRNTTFIALTPFNGKTNVIYDRLSIHEAMKKAHETMRNHK